MRLLGAYGLRARLFHTPRILFLIALYFFLLTLHLLALHLLTLYFFFHTLHLLA